MMKNNTPDIFLSFFFFFFFFFVLVGSLFLLFLFLQPTKRFLGQRILQL